MAYKDKLLHHYHELNLRQRLRYNLIDRFRFSGLERFFFEGCKDNPGQMFLAERRGLYEAILKHAPRHCFEVGTYTGGGSTFFLANAFAKQGQGKVITTEIDKNLHEGCKNFYQKQLPHLMPHVEFILGSDLNAFLPYLENGVDCFFLDGAEDASQTVAQYNFFEPYCSPGTVMMAHDWNTDKMKGLRKFLPSEAKISWRVELHLEAPHSVGFVVMVAE
ncbi:class I SAM-dependent methyltransferase [Desulfobacterota bacterium M19]